MDPMALVGLVNVLLATVDINAVVQRVDVPAVVGRVDVNGVLARIDVAALVERTEFGAIVARSTAGLASDSVDAVRSAGVTLDGIVHGWIDRLLRRERSSTPGGPVLLVETETTDP
jgi:hypothetical protein